jgi:hypothetical protein
MNRSRFGILAGIAGAAFATWWWRARAGSPAAPTHERGEVIFRNAPTV